MNTCCCVSRISYIDGDKGILRYRGYPIEQIAERATFEETAFLLLHGELPTDSQLKEFNRSLMKHCHVHEDVKKFISSFRHDAHPMAMFAATMAVNGSLYPSSNPSIAGQDVYKDKAVRNEQILRILGQAPVIGALIHRHRSGQTINGPDESLGYTENFFNMMDKKGEVAYRPNPKLVHALDVLFILHQEHELNCSTAATRHLASSGVDVYTAIAGAIGALYGPRHGGANEAVVRMLETIGSKEEVPKFIESVKKGEKKLMGFGHRVYKNYDPRAKLIRRLADEVFDVVGREPLVEVAMELERVALSDEYFVKRKLYPNVDFYSGLIYKALGFPTDFFPILFVIPRITGWLSHWNEFLDDPDNKIVRPFQVYKGSGLRNFPSGDLKYHPKLTPDEQLVLPFSAEVRRREAGQILYR
eukprot:Cvel_26263.t1-p1 / transcript=Cvel_26263.t1 / gene=Cvel_26263 / organism=Chromera_velia_CCMP2878 / gene_product=Citrate synthase, peroxisomal, putative / transcript_product=Citrate synthase, peroxisomal, putative / location=Cvel_scaffold3098:9177-20022(-) / protein_length=415 / sequence_SO=supercontig / SO=protein_coding / is_pseudo=false